MHGRSTQIITADAAEDGCVIAETAGHHCEIRRRATKPFSSREHVPQQFADSEDQVRLFQVRTPLTISGIAEFWLLHPARPLPPQQTTFNLKGRFVNLFSFFRLACPAQEETVFVVA